VLSLTGLSFALSVGRAGLVQSERTVVPAEVKQRSRTTESSLGPDGAAIGFSVGNRAGAAYRSGRLAEQVGVAMRSIVKALAVAGLLAAGPAGAADFTPAVIFDMGGKFDKSFNEAAYNGAEKFKAETGLPYLEFEITNESQRDQALRRMAQRADIVVAVGFGFSTPLETISAEFPDKKFVIIDSVVDKPNVESVVFKEHEGSFLVGMAAALASKTGKVGFVGGMDIPLIRNFASGYVQGGKYVDPNAQVIVNYAGTTPAAWNDPARGGELAIGQFGQGADVVYAAAGATGLGVLQAAKDRSKLAIGVDSNQNYLHPGTILTSMVKRVDLAVYDAMKGAKDGTWKPGLRVLGLKEDGIAVAIDDNNRKLITADMEKKLAEAREGIISGKIKVTDYMAK
jgi:basic membrane protein A